MSSSQAGLVQSGWHAGYVVSLVAAGLLADRFGARRTFLAMSVAACATTLAFAAFSVDHLSALALYSLAGVAAGGSYTPVLTLIAQRFPAVSRGRAMGWYIAAGSLSYGIGLAMSGPLVAWGGWRFSLYVAAFGTVVGTAMAFRLMRGIPDEPHVAEAQAPVLARVSEVVRNRPAMLVILAYTFHGWELLGLWAWLPAFLAVAVARGASVDGAMVGMGALLAGLAHFTSMAGSLWGGAWSDRFGRTAVMLGMAIASLACSLAFGWLLAAPLWVLVAVAVIFNLTAVGDSVVYSTAITEVVTPRILGTAYAIRSILGFGAGALSAWLFGVVLDATRAAGYPEGTVWGLAWGTLALGALPGPICAWLLRRHPASAAMAGGRR